MTSSNPESSAQVPRYFGVLAGVVQKYSWGKVGRASRIFPFSPGLDEKESLAEYWLGAHPKAPSVLSACSGVSGSLLDLIQSDPHGTVGLSDDDGKSPQLSFLLKVLSINPAFGLSIQAHPNKAHAEQLHRRDPAHYPDVNHKPEVGVALSPVTLLYGFRGLQEIQGMLSAYPELRSLFSAGTVCALADQHERELSDESVVLKSLYRELLTANSEVLVSSIRALAARFEHAQTIPEEICIMNRLRAQYGDEDVGLPALFVMNRVTLKPGEALFIGPNVAHAYLDGDVVECMACSDNVVRAGLTPKFKDVNTLTEMLEYRSGLPAIIKPSEGAQQGFFDVPVAASEFALCFAPEGETPLVLQASSAPRVLLCLGGEMVVSHTDSGCAISLQDGGAAFIPPGQEGYRIERRAASVYVASSGNRGPS